MPRPLVRQAHRGVFQMKKNRFFVLGMLAVLLTFGLVLAGCDNGSTGEGSKPTSPSAAYLNAKDWVCTTGNLPTDITSITMKLSGTNQWAQTYNGTGTNNGKTITGTYKLSGLTATSTITGGDLPGRPANGTSYSFTFTSAQPTTFTFESWVFNRQP